MSAARTSDWGQGLPRQMPTRTGSKVNNPLRRLLGSVLVSALLVVYGCGGGGAETAASAPPDSFTLQVQPTLQQTPVWCWAASAEMIFKYYGLPNINSVGNYQCGLIAAWFAGTPCAVDCSRCVVAVGAMSSMQQVINGYGPYVHSIGYQSRVLSSALVFRPLSKPELATEISSGRPVIVGINPRGGFALPNASQHVAVVVGYDFTAGKQNVIVNDPFPFQYPPYNQYPNPYVTAGGSQVGIGRYSVPYDSFISQLVWANTIFGIK